MLISKENQLGKLFLLAIIPFFFSSCENEDLLLESEELLLTETLSVNTTISHTDVIYKREEIHLLFTEIEFLFTPTGFFFGTCANNTIDTLSHGQIQTIVDFGDGCNDWNVFQKGKYIVTTFETDTLITKTIVFMDFQVNDLIVNGSFEEARSPIDPDIGSFTYKSTTQIALENTGCSDKDFSINRVLAYDWFPYIMTYKTFDVQVSVPSFEFTSQIDDPLIYDVFFCNSSSFYASGIQSGSIFKDGVESEFTIDHTTCDNFVELTVVDSTETIDFERPEIAFDYCSLFEE